MNEHEKLAAAVAAMGALPMPVGNPLKYRPGRSSAPGRPSKVAAFLAGARNGRAVCGG
ncbi:hypothetical protein ACLQ2N_08425 [Streptomyces sp. DT224]|uniref:hypothetical protein n=1 Tax=Streptomyces sp. DT224 TaxID=3393426 RepID=UPI003CE86253